MNIWYKIEHRYNCSVIPVEVLKETEHTVTYINTRWDKDGHEERAHKRTSDHSFCRTLDGAKEKAFAFIDRRITQSERAIAKAKEQRAEIEKLK